MASKDKEIREVADALDSLLSELRVTVGDLTAMLQPPPATAGPPPELPPGHDERLVTP